MWLHGYVQHERWEVMSLYQIKNKDPIIDLLRELIDTRAGMEGVTFGKMLRTIERETEGEIRYGMLWAWFVGGTKYPRYASVARLYLSMRSYSRKPVAIGQTEANPVSNKKLRLVSRAA
jgi:hypothetical protein